MDGNPGETRQHPAGAHQVHPPTRNQMVEGQPVGAGDMDPPQPRSDPPAGPIEIRDHCGDQPCTGKGQEPVEPA